MRYYHGSSSSFAAGTVLVARFNPKGGAAQSRDSKGLAVEDFVESLRPSREISRMKAVYMAPSPERLWDVHGGSDDYIYEVRPVGRVTVADFSWIDEISRLVMPRVLRSGKRVRPVIDLTMHPEASEYAYNYWHHVPYPHGIWEYLASKIRIVKLVPRDEVERWSDR